MKTIKKHMFQTDDGQLFETVKDAKRHIAKKRYMRQLIIASYHVKTQDTIYHYILNDEMNNILDYTCYHDAKAMMHLLKKHPYTYYEKQTDGSYNARLNIELVNVQELRSLDDNVRIESYDDDTPYTTETLIAHMNKYIDSNEDVTEQLISIYVEQDTELHIFCKDIFDYNSPFIN